MEIRNTSKRYGFVSMALHWIIALGVLFMLGLGKYMKEMEEGSFEKFQTYQLHKSIGITIFILVVVRIVWRLINKVPAAPATLKPWEKFAMRFTHYGFYVLLVLMPLAGWATVSASPLNVPTELYGAIPWPHIPWIADMRGEDLEHFFHEIHETLAWGIIGLFVLHMAGVFKHTFILKDGTLQRMLPWGNK